MANSGDEEEVEIPEHKPFCPKCGSTDIRGSHAHRALDHLLRTFGRHPFRCRSCRRRFYMRKPAPPDEAPNARSDAEDKKNSRVG